MKLTKLGVAEVKALVAELRTMAELPLGPNPRALARAKEIRFQLQGQDGASPTSVAKADSVYRDLEVLLHSHRWQDEPSLEGFRKQIKSGCDRLGAHLGL